MRKALLLTYLAIYIFPGITKAQYVDIPDANFRAYLQYAYPSCMNAQGQLDTTCNEILTAESLMLSSGAGIAGCVTDFTGLQYFKTLKTLDISGHYCLQIFPYIQSLKSLSAVECPPLKLSSLPNGLKSFTAGWLWYSSMDDHPPFINDNNGHMPDSLQYLSVKNCISQTLFHMPPLPNGLKYLDIAMVNVDSLPPLPDSLEYLNCPGNYRLTTLHTLPSKLRYLECWNTNITHVSSFPDSLRYLYFWGLDSVPAFPSFLKSMNISVYGPTSLPPLPPNLDSFILYLGSTLADIGPLPASLKYFDCSNSNITSINNFPPGLKCVRLNGNHSLTTLPSLPSSLQVLYCEDNGFTTLPEMITATGLQYLTISRSQVTSMPEIPAGVKIFTCQYNSLLHTLPASAGQVDTLICQGNALTSLPELGSRLKVLNCANNQLTSLPVLPDSLTDFDFHFNQVSEIPALPKSITLLATCGNPLQCLPSLDKFSNAFIIIYLDPSLVHCISNTLTNGYIMPSNGPFDYRYEWQGWPFWLNGSIQMPLCNPTNNIAGCKSFPVISGSIFYDLNSNSVQDNGEESKEGAKIQLDNSNTNVFSNSNGYFEVSADSLGNSSITMEPVLFYNTVPSTSSYNFTSYDTIVSRSYALQPNQVKDSVSLSLFPLTWAARPGFAYPLLIRYENVGTTVLNPSITLEYNNAKLQYDSSDVTMVNNGNKLSFSGNNVAPGQKKYITVYFRIRPSAVIGDTLHTQASLTAGSQNNNSILTTVIGGSFDPNDKQATPQLSPLQVINGDYIDYTIRFQNTGTDTAFNIVISDTLSSDLQWNSLLVTASSHNCKVTVKDNVVFFEFLNILLPDSNVNEIKSHGFVSFKIKPQPTVAVNSTITNKAAIYFDYNSPVITNTAGTLIKNFIVVPLRLISFSAVPQNDNTILLSWNTTNEINTKQFIIEKGDDGDRFSAVTNVLAKGKASNNYSFPVADANTGIVFYRLKIVDNNGSFIYSPIIKIDRRKNAAGISILTNPVKDVLVLNISGRSLYNTYAYIINMQGAVVKSFIVKEGNQTVTVNNLARGMYYLKTVNSVSKFVTW